MIELRRTDNTNLDFRNLVRELDAYLTVTDQEEHAFYDQYNGLEGINHVVVAYKNGTAVACGAFKKYADTTVEVKRMYTAPVARGRGLAGSVLRELETWAAELGYTRAVLETGKRQVAAMAFYPRLGYSVIESYGPYLGMDNSVCFGKGLGTT